MGADNAENLLGVVRENEFGKDACIIGEVISDHPGKVFMKTAIGGTRIVVCFRENSSRESADLRACIFQISPNLVVNQLMVEIQ